MAVLDMGRKPKISNEQLLEAYNKYHGLEGRKQKSLRSLAEDLGVPQSALSQRLQRFTPPEEPGLPKSEPKSIEM